MSMFDTETEEEVISETEEDLKEPPMYKVILLNDDYTPMDFVVQVLVYFFKKSLSEATDIMYSVHNSGSGIAGVYTYEIAETKIVSVHNAAREGGFPLRCVMDKE